MIIGVILAYHFSFIRLSKNCGWFYANFRHNKQIICVFSPTVHTFNPTVGPSYIEIHARVHLIYIYIEREIDTETETDRQIREKNIQIFSIYIYIYIYRERERESITDGQT